MEISGGALGLKQKRNLAFVYNSMSDGELDEGSTWEATISAAHHQLDNLICLLDINNQQANGHWKKGLPRILDTLEALGRARLEGGGWCG